MEKFPDPPVIPNPPIIRYSRVNGLKGLKLQPIQLLDSAVSSSTSDHKPDTIWLHREQLPAPNPLSFPSSKSNETQTIANFWQQILMLHFVLILWIVLIFSARGIALSLPKRIFKIPFNFLILIFHFRWYMVYIWVTFNVHPSNEFTAFIDKLIEKNKSISSKHGGVNMLPWTCKKNLNKTIYFL